MTRVHYSVSHFVAQAFACSGLHWWEHSAINGSLYRPTEIAVGRGNAGKAMIKLARQRRRFEKWQLAGGINLLENELTKYGQWMYEFDLGNGIKTPVYTDVINQVHKVRHSMIFSFLDSVSFDYKSASVLDIACNEGYFAFEALKHGCKFALGLDVRKENIEKALFIQRALQYQNCEFREADIFEFETRDTYELVFLLGIIYHVENPIGLLRKSADLTSKFLIVETQLCQSQQKAISFGWGVPGKYLEGEEYFVVYDEQQETNPLASTGNVFSLIPNLSAVIKILRKLGFKSVIQLYPNNQVQEFQYNKVDRAILVGIK
ncbi:methyltransferase domain-containing protein [Microcoleus sp. Z1_A1]|uniref:methyltransferase domain-containing protein n=1 Tax=unclassified Microcoleus TaxID=2642155 RepID=UPI002FD127CB